MKSLTEHMRTRLNEGQFDDLLMLDKANENLHALAAIAAADSTNSLAIGAISKELPERGTFALLGRMLGNVQEFSDRSIELKLIDTVVKKFDLLQSRYTSSDLEWLTAYTPQELANVKKVVSHGLIATFVNLLHDGAVKSEYKPYITKKTLRDPASIYWKALRPSTKHTKNLESAFDVIGTKYKCRVEVVHDEKYGLLSVRYTPR